LELHLEEPVSTESIRIGWRTGHETSDLAVELSQDGTRWTPARLNWEHHPSDRRYAQSWSEGIFDAKRRFLGIRFSFLDTLSSRPVSVTEVELGRAPDPASVAYLSGGAEIWFDQATTEFPSFLADAHPVEARLAPWVCWGHELDGFAGPPLNEWPESWKQLETATPHTWPAAGTGRQFLVYPALGGLAPSIRLHRLRDGLEDFEYLRAAMELGVDDRLIQPDNMKVCRWEHFDNAVGPGKLDEIRQELQELRTAIGRGVTKAAREN
jgi:hypothetical protein